MPNCTFFISGNIFTWHSQPLEESHLEQFWNRKCDVAVQHRLSVNGFEVKCIGYAWYQHVKQI